MRSIANATASGSLRRFEPGTPRRLERIPLVGVRALRPGDREPGGAGDRYQTVEDGELTEDAPRIRSGGALPEALAEEHVTTRRGQLPDRPQRRRRARPRVARTDAEHEVTLVGEARHVRLGELDPIGEPAHRGGATATVELVPAGVDAGAGRGRVRCDDPQQQLAPAAAQIERVPAGSQGQTADQVRGPSLAERRVEREPGVGRLE